MKISFKTKSDEGKFKQFVCKNKAILKAFLAFGEAMKNPVRLLFRGLSEALDLICPEN